MKFFKSKKTKEAQSLLHRSRNPSNLRAQTFSHHAVRDRDASRAASRGEKPPRRVKSSLERAFYGFLTVLCIASVGYVMWLETTPRIKVVSLQGNAADSAAVLLRDEADYVEGISAILKQSLSNRSKIFMNSNNVASEILKQFPEFGDAVVSIPLVSHRPIVSITPRAPVLKLETNKGLYLADMSGTVLAAVDDIPDGTDLDNLAALPLIEDQTATDYTVGSRFITEETARFIVDVHSQLVITKIPTAKLYLPRDTPNELRIQFPEKPYFAKLDTTSDVRRQIGSLRAALAYIDERGSVVNEYIDVRVEGKVFFK